MDISQFILINSIMKRTLIAFILSFITFQVFTQMPSLFKYQSVLRKADGSVLANQKVSMRISLLQDSIAGRTDYSEIHSAVTNSFGLINLNIGGGTDTSGSISNINWSSGSYFMKIEIDATGGSNYSLAGINQLLPVPFALYSNRTNTKGAFQISGSNDLSPDSALFEVKDKNGNVVFAVYADGAELIVNPAAKGARGGFSVGGRTSVKGSNVDNIMLITPDSVRFYIDNSPVKGSKGGFAIGGRTTTKGANPEYLHVTQDSTRIYTSDTLAGFGVGSLNGLTTSSYMHLNTFNYFIGQESGENVTPGNPLWYSGKYNSVIGLQAGKNLTSGAYNVLMGYNTGFATTTGIENTASGDFALFRNSTGSFNIALGTDALLNNTTGNYNASTGASALYSNTSGSQNTAVGTSSLFSNTSGSYNSAIGTNALYNNTIGIYNDATGVQALYSNTTGIQNTASGFSSLFNDSSGSYNSAFGTNALYFNTVGEDNAALGASSLYGNTSGSENTASGYSSLYSNDTGSFNTATGSQALFNNTEGEQNTASGYFSLFGNIFGSYNSAYGAYALDTNTTGDDNTAIGYEALNTNTAGSGNSALGEYALYTNMEGNNNTAIGYSADVATENLSNSTVIGYNAVVNASNKVVIGNADVTSIGGYADWTNYSDKRLKENILYKDNLGLNFINKLHTVSYSYRADNNKRRRDGLIAQDVQEALSELGLDFSGLVIDSDSAKTLNLSYSDFVIPLINAVQQLSRQNNELEKRNENLTNKDLQLQKDIEEIKEMLRQKGLQ